MAAVATLAFGFERDAVQHELRRLAFGDDAGRAAGRVAARSAGERKAIGSVAAIGARINREGEERNRGVGDEQRRRAAHARAAVAADHPEPAFAAIAFGADVHRADPRLGKQEPDRGVAAHAETASAAAARVVEVQLGFEQVGRKAAFAAESVGDHLDRIDLDRARLDPDEGAAAIAGAPITREVVERAFLLAAKAFAAIAGLVPNVAAVAAIALGLDAEHVHDNLRRPGKREGRFAAIAVAAIGAVDVEPDAAPAAIAFGIEEDGSCAQRATARVERHLAAKAVSACRGREFGISEEALAARPIGAQLDPVDDRLSAGEVEGDDSAHAVAARAGLVGVAPEAVGVEVEEAAAHRSAAHADGDFTAAADAAAAGARLGRLDEEKALACEELAGGFDIEGIEGERAVLLDDQLDRAARAVGGITVKGSAAIAVRHDI